MSKNVILACVFILASSAAAQAVVFKYDPSLIGSARGDGPYVVGSLIQVGASNQLITHLGAQDADAAVDAQDPDGADGLTGFADDDGFFRGFIDVGLWNATGTTLLGSVRVTSGDPVVGTYRYARMSTPVVLLAGTQYLLGATVGGGIEWFIDDGSAPVPFSTEVGFTLLQNRFANGGTLAAPTLDGGGTLGRWAPANAAAFIPEPATATMALLGLGGLMMRRRRMA